MADVWNIVGNNDMTRTQAERVQAHMKALKSADYNYNATKIVNTPGLDDATKAKITSDLLDAKMQQNLQGSAMNQFTDKMIEDHTKKATSSWIDNWWGGISKPPTHGSMTQPPTSPARPKGVPDNAVWNPTTKTWQIQQQ